MYCDLVLRVSYPYTAPIRLCASFTSTITEVFGYYMILPPSGYEIISAFNGRIVQPELSLGFQKIPNNARIIIINKKKREVIVKKAKEFECKIPEQARLTDIEFNHLEIVRGQDSIFKNMLSEIVVKTPPTPIFQANSTIYYRRRLSEAPLPYVYTRAELMRMSFYKNLPDDKSKDKMRNKKTKRRD